MKIKSNIFLEGRSVLLLFLVSVLVCAGAAEDKKEEACPRPAPGSLVLAPPEMHSHNGRLELTLKFEISEDTHGLLRFCYVNESGMQAPTLRVNPGDELIIHFRNQLPGNNDQSVHAMNHDSGQCAEAEMSLAATNLHFHGLSVPPKCHQDDVMRTLIGPGAAFDYKLRIPADAAPGLYWYHPHPHPFGETQVQGGASGALVVQGIANVHPEIVGLPERVLVLRDQKLPMGAKRTVGQPVPGWDVSLNYVPVLYPGYAPAVLNATPHHKEFWRVLNAAADTIFDLQVMVNNTPRSLRLLAIDGVPLNASGAREGSLAATDVLLPPGSRAEFIVETPRPGDHAELISKAWDTGPDGENDPQRTIATIVSDNHPSVQPRRVRKTESKCKSAGMGRLTSLATAMPVAQRKLYFSEVKDDPAFGGTSFYLTVDGQKPTRFKMEDPPNMVVRQGSVEDWTIENRSREEHVFHIHQIHFQVIAKDGKPIHDPAIRDTIGLPYWKGEGPYPSVKLRMDFRDPNIVGTLMYHCHILQHSSNGMMGMVQVLPARAGQQAEYKVYGTSLLLWR